MTIEALFKFHTMTSFTSTPNILKLIVTSFINIFLVAVLFASFLLELLDQVTDVFSKVNHPDHVNTLVSILKQK